MNQLFVLLIFLLGVIHSCRAGCDDGSHPIQVRYLEVLNILQRHNTNCSEYNAKSCCSEQLADKIVANNEANGGCNISSLCLEFGIPLACGVVCSPDITEAYTSTGKIRVCAPYADAAYFICATSQLPYGGEGQCVQLQHAFSSAKAWFTYLGLVYDPEDDPPKCFSPLL